MDFLVLDDEMIPEPPCQDLTERGFGMIDKGVRKLVRAVWSLGFRTVNSCAGHVDTNEVVPYVVIAVDVYDMNQLSKLFVAVARFNRTFGRNGNLPRPLDTWVLSPQTVRGETLAFLRPQTLNEKNSREELARLRVLGEKLAMHLKDQCRDLFSSSR